MRITDKFVFFYGGEFSQWYKNPIIFEGVSYNCAEQAMMASKARMMCDEDTLKLIMSAVTPKEQKALGRKVKNFDATLWNAGCQNIVFKINFAKFSQSEFLKAKMLSMGDRIFVEASPYDRIWGIGMSENDYGVEDIHSWNGRNWLGYALSAVRDALVCK